MGRGRSVYKQDCHVIVRIAMAERQVIKVVKAPPPLTGADNTDVQEQLADIPILKQQLAVAL